MYGDENEVDDEGREEIMYHLSKAHFVTEIVKNIVLDCRVWLILFWKWGNSKMWGRPWSHHKAGLGPSWSCAFWLWQMSVWSGNIVLFTSVLRLENSLLILSLHSRNNDRKGNTGMAMTKKMCAELSQVAQNTPQASVSAHRKCLRNLEFLSLPSS